MGLHPFIKVFQSHQAMDGRLCATESRLRQQRVPPSAGLEPDQQASA